MPGNTKLQNSAWTEQHDAYCLEQQITPSAQFLWRYLITEGVGTEVEIDLSDFNKQVAKHRGKPYCRLTLKNALLQLAQHRVVNIIREYTWKVVKIVTRPLDWLKPKKNLQKQNKNYNLQTSNDLSAVQGENSSSKDHFRDEMIAECEEVLSECEKAGIPFDPEQSPEILEYSLEDVKAAISLFHSRGGHETDWRGRPKIRNPQGWLLSCLKKGYYLPKESWSFAGLLAALGVQL
ncbi:hypothetical protein [Nostoc sp. FACHB-110]|uniref:hypothetical protein n=1 Tax=Nostoc sp. FACHB-110 TaxID=2692834 RepID=UPI0016885429|nr:hypothetical protein [Nostoc sp. FACHB-110]MBD2435834.1 hypothetical protein [Nostoc sp. FACHB-110]